MEYPNTRNERGLVKNGASVLVKVIDFSIRRSTFVANIHQNQTSFTLTTQIMITVPPPGGGGSIVVHVCSSSSSSNVGFGNLSICKHVHFFGVKVLPIA